MQVPIEYVEGYFLADLTVEYLHRTVKDYLARDDVWEGILHATIGTSFNPNVSLCKSSIVMLKILDPEHLYG
jgi:hypothetical protein